MTPKPQPGEHWGYRSKTGLGEPLSEVELLQYGPKTAGQKVRIRHIAGEYPGLDEWVPRQRLIVPWDEAEDFMADERRMRVAVEVSEAEADETTINALTHLISAFQLDAAIEVDSSYRTFGLLTITDQEAVRRVLPVPLDDLLDDPLVFENRHGQLMGPARVAVAIAKRVCAEAPDRVMQSVLADEAEEHRAMITGKYSGKQYIEPEVVQITAREYSEPIWQILRSWCGADTVARYDELATLRAEVTRLRQIITEQVNFLRQDRHPHLAKALEKQLNEVTMIDE